MVSISQLRNYQKEWAFLVCTYRTQWTLTNNINTDRPWFSPPCAEPVGFVLFSNYNGFTASPLVEFRICSTDVKLLIHSNKWKLILSNTVIHKISHLLKNNISFIYVRLILFLTGPTNSGIQTNWTDLTLINPRLTHQKCTTRTRGSCCLQNKQVKWRGESLHTRKFHRCLIMTLVFFKLKYGSD